MTELTDCIWYALPSVDANCKESPASADDANCVTSILPDWLVSTEAAARVAVAPDVPPVIVSFAWKVPDLLGIDLQRKSFLIHQLLYNKHAQDRLHLSLPDRFDLDFVLDYLASL